VIDSLSPDKLSELEAKHGDLYLADTPQGPMYFRRPKRPEVMAAHAQQKKGQSLYAGEEIALRCVVYPEADALKELFERFPLLSDTVGAAILTVAQGDESARVGK
jgi:hypothetical protein